MVGFDEYLKLRLRPPGRPVMYQSWRDLSFLHFSIDPELLRPTLPDGLDIDTFPDAQGRERAWVGLVPFWMTNIRFRGLPAIPGTRTFPETNLRTYVHRNGKQPGVWFFSLEAANRLACATARRFFGLPYHWSKMDVVKAGTCIDYDSSRRRDVRVSCRASVQTLDPLENPQPGSLEFFLIERYLLHALHRGNLVTGRVHHSPYALRRLELMSLKESLTTSNGVPAQTWEHFVYSPGVDVEVFGIRS